MFKNTTRRGLAIASALSLAFAGLVSAPASANVAFELKPSAGTGYTTFVTETFTLETVLGSANPSGGAQLKYAVSKATGFDVDAVSSTSATAALVDKEILTGSTSEVVPAAGATQTSRNYFRLAIDGATTASASVTVTVTAFIDVDNDGVVDAAEPQSAQTVSFKKYSDVASVVALTQPIQGDTSLKGTATLTDINADQVQSAVTFVASIGGTATGSATLASGVYSTAVSALAANATVSAVVKVAGEQIGAASSTLTVTAASAVVVTASAVTSDNAKGTLVRKNSAFAVTGKVLNGSTSTASGVAGVAVTALVTTSATLGSSTTITVNGVTYTDSAKLPTALALTTDASGNVTLNVTSAGLAADATIGFRFTSQNVVSDLFTTTQKDAQYTATAAGTGYLTVAPSGAFSVDYTVADQWGVAAPAGHRVAVAYNGTTKYVNLSAGAAKVDFTATSSAATLNVENIALESQNTSTLNWSTVSTAVTASVVVVKATSVAASFTTAPTHSTAVDVARATTSNTAGFTNKVEITGKVNHAGQSVTVTSTGAKFSNASQGVAAVANTYTTTADGNGNFTISAYVHVAGTATFNYVAGTATASTTIKVNTPNGTNGTALDVTSNAAGNTIEPGKTIVAKISLKDEFGNVIAADDAATESFGVTVTGLGFVGALPTKLNSSGEATVTVLLGSADEGNVVITATYSKDGSTANAITKVLTIAVAKAAAPEVNAVIGSYNGRWAVRVENAKGAVVSVKVGGNWFKYTSLNENYLFSRKSVVGRTLAVAVYVNGQLENVSTITVK
jgi:hypothetical protein